MHWLYLFEEAAITTSSLSSIKTVYEIIIKINDGIACCWETLSGSVSSFWDRCESAKVSVTRRMDRKMMALSSPLSSLPHTFCVHVVNCCCSFFFHIISSIHPLFRLFSTVYDRTTVRTSYVSYDPYEIFQNFKFIMTYCTYMFMPDFYARFTVRP